MSAIVSVSRRASGRAIVAAVVVAVVGSASAAAAAKPKPKQEEIVRLIEALRSGEPRTRYMAVDPILQQRKSTVEELIQVIDPANADKYGNEARSAAAYVLGEFRAVEAVPVLSKALADQLDPIFGSNMSRYSGAVLQALVEIGRPAVPAMIENIQTSDDRTLRKRSLSVLYDVLGGKRGLFELLAELEKRTDDDETRRRLQESTTWAREHYKERKEGLY